MILPLLALAPLVPTAWAWGAAGKHNHTSLASIKLADKIGHEIVATIAQIHLFPETREALCHLLPAEAKCHLAPIAAWADQVRMRYRGTGPMHYVNGEYSYLCKKGCQSRGNSRSSRQRRGISEEWGRS